MERKAAPEGKGFVFSPKRPALWALGFYALLACILTFPLIFRMNSSIYGFYDHVSTDLFASIHYYFWWIREAILGLKGSPLSIPFFAAPFGSRMFFANFTGFLMLPVTAIFGVLFSYNTVILGNLILSGLGMFLLVRYVTKSAAAGLIAGVVYAFCPNMLVRSYTTFDSTQVQWIPFYFLFLLRFFDNRTWKNAILAGVFLLCNILLTMPYYLVYLPVQTVVFLAVYSVVRVRGEKDGFGGFVRGLTSPEALRAWGKVAAVLACAVIVFGVYYKVIVGGSASATYQARTATELSNLSLIPKDYLVPHPRSALLKGDFKETYWDAVPRPEKNADSDVAYIGYIAMILALIGVIRGQGAARWFFLTGSLVAFWATMGPTLFGLPTPSSLIHLYAPFARRILLYKAYVQFGVAGLAGMGTAFILPRIKTAGTTAIFLVLVCLGMLLEYSLVPPCLSVNLSQTPEVYVKARTLPEKSVIIEAPLKRVNGNLYQGYVYYQTYHHKPLFNPYMGLSLVPERMRPFYNQMNVPLEAGEYANLAALRYLGVTHLIYHLYIGTTTVRFASFAAPGLMEGKIDGLRRLYEGPRKLGGEYISPYDYTFADLHEITAEPCPVALTFDYHSPFEPWTGFQAQDGLLNAGYYSALFDPEPSFYYPLPKGTGMERIMRKDGKVAATNLSDKPVTFDLTFEAKATDNRTLEVRWNGKPMATVPIGPDALEATVSGFTLDAAKTGEITFVPSGGTFEYTIDVGQGVVPLQATAVLANVRAVKR